MHDERDVSRGHVCTPSDGGLLCLYPLPTPGAIGSPCMQPSDCVGSQCISTGVCSVRCVSGNDDCPGGFDCENTSGIDFYCIATPAPAPSKSKGGCALAVPASGEGTGAWWILAGWLAATRAQRRRPAP